MYKKSEIIIRLIHKRRKNLYLLVRLITRLCVKDLDLTKKKFKNIGIDMRMSKIKKLPLFRNKGEEKNGSYNPYIFTRKRKLVDL